MRQLRAWFTRLGGLFGKERRERELSVEMESHLKMHVEDNLRAGMTPEQARREALLKLGGVEQTKEEYRARRGLPFLETSFRDLYFAARVLHKNPGFTSIVVLTLAIGIGANTAIFGLANAAFFRPLPYPHAERLAFLWQNNRRTGEAEGLVSYPNFSDWRSQSHSFADMAFFMSGKSILTSKGGDPEFISGGLVSVNFFSVLGVSPAIGRSFSPDEQIPGHANVSVISYHFWRTRFGGDPQVLGRSVVAANGEKHTVIGVMPPGFSFPDKTDVWTPREVGGFFKTKARQYPNQHVIGRLNPGVTWTQAQAELDTIAARLAAEYPAIDGGVGVRIVPLRQQLTQKVSQGLVLLWAAIAGVLLIACLNAANLILARAAGRAKEISIRYSLGATRSRIIKQFLCESLLLASMAAAAGILLAVWILNLVAKLNPDLAKLSGSVFDPRVLAYTIAITGLTSLVCGLLPALSAPKVDLSRALREASSGHAAPSAQALRKLLIVAQVSLAFVLLVGSGLLVRSLWRIFAVPPGFDAEHVLTLHVYWPGAPANSTDEKKRNSLYMELLARLRALPGVISAGATSNVLFPSEMYKVPFVIEGQPTEPSGQRPFLPNGEATPDYFRVMGIPLMHGRVFTRADTIQDAPPVIIIDETMAQRYWPNEEPIGKRLKFDDPNFRSPWFTVIGVVGDVRQEGLEQPAGLVSYVPSDGEWADDLVLRSRNDPRTIVAAVREQVRSVDRNLAVANVGVLSDLLSLRESQRKFNALLLGSLASVALLLAAIGIYGTVSYWVKQRTAEIGIRMALGADQKNIFRLAVARGMILIFAGLVVGFAGALAGTRLIASLLFGVTAYDPATFCAIAILLLLASLAACWIPARRATRVDPLVALRYE
ncbi:MAG: ABC transporter permease [Candidatus Acidiferrum sp.]